MKNIKKILYSLSVFSALFLFAVCSEKNPVDPGPGPDPGPGNGGTDTSKSDTGTWTESGGRLNIVSGKMIGECVFDTSTSSYRFDTVSVPGTKAVPYALSGDSLRLTFYDTLRDPQTSQIEVIRAEVWRYARQQGTGTNLFGTWVCNSKPGVTYNTGSKDIDPGNVWDYVNAVSDTVSLNTDYTYGRGQKITYSAALDQMFLDSLYDMLVIYKQDFTNLSVAKGATITVSDPALSPNLTVTVSGSYPNNQATAAYGTLTATLYRVPATTQQCVTSLSTYGEVVGFYLQDLDVAYGGTGKRLARR